jgi:hypothetical protein
MSDGTTKSAIDAMRTLTLQIDQTIEGLVDAHGFTFSQMSATATEAIAQFTGAVGDTGDPWHLTLQQPGNGELTVILARGNSQARAVTLSIRIGSQDARTLAEGVGLAISFVAFTEQLRSAL